ncbi:NPCL1 protein, partial [Psophia crepitans]|nr:NPCL1 protein [Psophia crepitans]
FSGVLSEEVLRALLELQERLAATTAWASGKEVTLSDVCYAPLNPTGPGLGDCCVNSVTQYFQNNGTHLAMTATQTDGKVTGTVDWRDHLMYCVKWVPLPGGGGELWGWVTGMPSGCRAQHDGCGGP